MTQNREGQRQKVHLIHSFDAYAGSQRIGRAILQAFRKSGADVTVRLGFGGRGFLSELPEVRPDIRCDDVPTRKMLYPVWTLLALLPTAWAAMRGQIIWINSIHAAGPALLAILLFPRRTLIHLHEVGFPRIFQAILKFAAWRGSTIVCVSQDQASRIALAAHILPNPVAAPADDPITRQDRLLFVGTTQPIKGFDLFVGTCQHLQHVPLRKAAYLSDEIRHDRALVKAARAAGIEIVFGEQSPDAIYADGYLVLLCTDPMLWTETFSLVAAEAVARLVPVAGAGVTVLHEVVGDALAFDEPFRNPEQIARAIADLWLDAERHDILRGACTRRRRNFSQGLFDNRVAALLQLLRART